MTASDAAGTALVVAVTVAVVVGPIGGAIAVPADGESGAATAASTAIAGGYVSDFDYSGDPLDRGWVDRSTGDDLRTSGSDLTAEGTGEDPFGQLDATFGRPIDVALGSFSFSGVRNGEQFYGLEVRLTGPNGGYLFKARQERNGEVVFKRTDGTKIATLTDDHGGNRFSVGIERTADGDGFTVSFNGQPVTTVENATYTRFTDLSVTFGGSEQAIDRIALEPPTVDSPLDLGAAGDSIRADGTATVAFGVNNTGTNASNATLRIDPASVPDSWTVVERSPNRGVWTSNTSYRVEELSGGSLDVPVVRYAVPEDATPGNYSVRAILERDGSVLDTATARVNVSGPGPLDLTVDDRSLPAGGETNLTFAVNNSDGRLRNATVRVTALPEGVAIAGYRGTLARAWGPDGWAVGVLSSGTVEPGVVLAAADDAEPGPRRLRVRASATANGTTYADTETATVEVTAASAPGVDLDLELRARSADAPEVSSESDATATFAAGDRNRLRVRLASVGENRSIDPEVELTTLGPASWRPFSFTSLNATGTWLIAERTFLPGGLAPGDVAVGGLVVDVPNASVGATYTLAAVARDGATVLDREQLAVAVVEPGGEADADPTALISVNDSSPSAGQPVRFDGTASTDPDGTIESYEWDFQDDFADDATGATATHTYPEPGTYTAKLTVREAAGTTATDRVTVEVGPADGDGGNGTDGGDGGDVGPPEERPPLAAASFSPGTPIPGGTVTLESESVGYEASIETTRWDLDGDGAFEAEGETVTTQFDETGTATVTLEVTDRAGNTNRTTVGIPVRAADAVPTATFTAEAVEPGETPIGLDVDAPGSGNGTALTVEVGETVLFNGSASTAPETRSIESYEWGFDDGETAANPYASVTHSFAEPGIYNVTLTVVDSGGASARAIRTVEVEPASSLRVLSFDAEIPGPMLKDSGMVNSYTATVEPVDRVKKVRFEFPGGETFTAESPSDAEAGTFTVTGVNADALAADGDSVLVTAVGESNETTESFGITVKDLPDWLAAFYDGDPKQTVDDNGRHYVADSHEPGALGAALGIASEGSKLISLFTIDVGSTTTINYTAETRVADFRDTSKLGLSVVVSAGAFRGGGGVSRVQGIQAQALIGESIALRGDASRPGAETDPERFGRRRGSIIVGLGPPKVPGPISVTAVKVNISLRYQYGWILGVRGGRLAVTGGSIRSGATLTAFVGADVDWGPFNAGKIGLTGQIGRTDDGDVFPKPRDNPERVGIDYESERRTKLEFTLQAGGGVLDYSQTLLQERAQVVGVDCEAVGTDAPDCSAAVGIGVDTASRATTTADAEGSWRVTSTFGDAPPDPGTDAVARLTEDRRRDSSPSVAARDGRVTAAWSAQVGDGSVLNGSEILASTRADGTWAAPQPVTDDDRLDLFPAVAAGDDRTVAWSRGDGGITAAGIDTPSDLVAGMDVAVAVDEGSGWSAPVALTDDDATDLRPAVAAANGTTAVAWVRDADGNASTTGDRRIRYALLNGTTVAAGGSLGAGRGVALAPARAGGGFTAAVLRGRGDGATVARLTVQDGTVAPTAAYPADGATEVAAAPGAVAWLAGNATDPVVGVAGPGSGGIERVPVEGPTGLADLGLFTASGTPLLAYSGIENGTRRPHYQVRALDGWLEPRALPTGTLSAGSVGAAASATELVTAFDARSAGRDGNASSADGEKADVFAVGRSLRPDLTANATATVAGTGGDVGVGAPTTVNYTVTNAGEATSGATTVALYNETGAVAARTVGPLAVGAHVEGSFAVPLGRAGAVRVVVDPGDTVAESDESNNATLARAAGPELEITGVRERRDGDRLELRVAVANRGPVPSGPVAVRVGVGGRTAERVLPGVGANHSTAAMVTLDAGRLNASAPAEVVLERVGSGDAAEAGAARPADRFRTLVLEPDLAVAAPIAVGRGPQGQGRRATLVVRNSGTGATPARVTLRTPAGSRSYRVTVPPGRGGGDTAGVRLSLAAPPLESGADLVVEVDPAGSLDADRTDNVRRVTPGSLGTATAGSRLRILNATGTTAANGTVAVRLRLGNPGAITVGERLAVTAEDGTVVGRRAVAVAPGNRTVTVGTNASTGGNYTVTTATGTATVRVVPTRPTLPGGTGPATDIDGDGRLEDVNGNGEFTVIDVALFLDVFDTEVVETRPDRFDFNDDGTVNVVDVAVLLEAT